MSFRTEQKEFDALEEGQWIDGVVAHQQTFDCQGKVAVTLAQRRIHHEVYDPCNHTIVFVKIGTALIGGLAQRDLKFHQLHEAAPKMVEEYFYSSTKVKVRVVKKSIKTNDQGHEKLHVKLSMLPEKKKVNRLSSQDSSRGRTALGDALTAAITKQGSR